MIKCFQVLLSISTCGATGGAGLRHLPDNGRAAAVAVGVGAGRGAGAGCGAVGGRGVAGQSVEMQFSFTSRHNHITGVVVIYAGLGHHSSETPWINKDALDGDYAPPPARSGAFLRCLHGAAAVSLVPVHLAVLVTRLAPGAAVRYELDHIIRDRRNILSSIPSGAPTWMRRPPPAEMPPRRGGGAPCRAPCAG